MADTTNSGSPNDFSGVSGAAGTPSGSAQLFGTQQNASLQNNLIGLTAAVAPSQDGAQSGIAQTPTSDSQNNAPNDYSGVQGIAGTPSGAAVLAPVTPTDPNAAVGLPTDNAPLPVARPDGLGLTADQQQDADQDQDDEQDGSSGSSSSSSGGSTSDDSGSSSGSSSGIGLGALTQLGSLQSGLGGILNTVGSLVGLGNIGSLANIGSLNGILGSLGGATSGLSSILSGNITGGLSSLLSGGTAGLTGILSSGSIAGLSTGLSSLLGGGSSGILSGLTGSGIGGLLSGNLGALTGGLGSITGSMGGLISGELGQLGGVTSMLTNMAGASSLTSMFGNSGVGSLLGKVGSPALQNQMTAANSQSSSQTDPCANCSVSNGQSSSAAATPTTGAGSPTAPSVANPATTNNAGSTLAPVSATADSTPIFAQTPNDGTVSPSLDSYYGANNQNPAISTVGGASDGQTPYFASGASGSSFTPTDTDTPEPISNSNGPSATPGDVSGVSGGAGTQSGDAGVEYQPVSASNGPSATPGDVSGVSGGTGTQSGGEDGLQYQPVSASGVTPGPGIPSYIDNPNIVQQPVDSTGVTYGPGVPSLIDTNGSPPGGDTVALDEVTVAAPSLSSPPAASGSDGTASPPVPDNQTNPFDVVQPQSVPLPPPVANAPPTPDTGVQGDDLGQSGKV